MSYYEYLGDRPSLHGNLPNGTMAMTAAMMNEQSLAHALAFNAPGGGNGSAGGRGLYTLMTVGMTTSKGETTEGSGGRLYGRGRLSFSSTHAVDGRALRRRKRTWRQRLVTLGTVAAVCYTILVTLLCVYLEEQRAAARPVARPVGLAFLPERNHDDDNTTSNQPQTALHIFYNVFLPATLPEFGAGLAVVDEQMEQMMHNLQVPAVRQAYGSFHLHYTLIGAAFPSPHYLEERYCQPHGVQCSPIAHLASGNEEHTLQALYDHCHHHEAAAAADAADAADATTTTVVAYLHSKGTFHPTPHNRNFRRALTDAALHVDCLTLSVDQCNVCGLQFVPFPIRTW
jgi:hypothetical protein